MEKKLQKREEPGIFIREGNRKYLGESRSCIWRGKRKMYSREKQEVALGEEKGRGKLGREQEAVFGEEAGSCVRGGNRKEH